MTDGKQAEVVGPGEPNNSILSDWVFDWIVATNPRDSALIPKKEIEDLVGLSWDSKTLSFVLVAAKRKLYTTTRFEFSVTEGGLYMLSPSERKEANNRRLRESLNRTKAVIASSATIPLEKLTTQERAEVEHARRVALHLYEEARRTMRRKWIQNAKADDEIKKIE